MRASQASEAFPTIPLGTQGDVQVLSEDESGAIKVLSPPSTLKVTVTGLKNDGTNAGSQWITATVHIENPSTQTLHGPSFGVVCAGDDKVGDNVAGGTYDDRKPIPPQSFDEGTVDLLAPENGITGQSFAPCMSPAVVRAGDQMTGVSYPIPDADLPALNVQPSPGS